MIRVLHVTNAYPSPERPAYGIFIKEQIESLESARIESTTLFIAPNGGVGGYLRYIAAVRRLGAAADVVHCHHLLCGVLALLGGLRSKMIVSFTSDGALNFKAGPAWLGAALFRLVSTLSVHNIYKSRVPSRFATKSSLLPNGVDSERFREGDRRAARLQLGLPVEGHLVLFVSAVRLDRPEKRYDFFRQVLAELQVGGDSKFVGVTMCDVPRDLVATYYRAVDVHLLTSEVEGSPNSVKEALASGVPVVSRDVGNVASMVDEVPGCAVFTTDNAPQVAEMVRRALGTHPGAVRDAFLRKGLGVAEIARRLEKIYESHSRIHT